MGTLAERIQKDILSAMKAGDKLKLETLRGLSSDLKYRKIAEGRDLLEADVEATLKQAAKKRRESIEGFKSGGRVDLAQKEEAELATILSYLPPDMTDAELDVLVRELVDGSGPKDPSRLGQLMKLVMPKVGNRAPGERVRARVMEYLKSGD